MRTSGADVCLSMMSLELGRRWSIVASIQNWFFTRPHRKLIRVPKTLAAFAAVAAGEPWSGRRDTQIAFENQLEAHDLKGAGDHTERAAGRGGSGGRTHAQLLYQLGLYFYHRESENAEEEVHLTLAGQGLVDQEDALPILRKQVMAQQFPSAYSAAIGVDRKFKLRPFVLLLKLLRHPLLDGYLSDADIAACVIGEAVSHSDREAQRIAEHIVDYRSRGVDALPDDFASRMKPARARGNPTAGKLIDTSLKDIANTAVQWLRYTGYAIPVPGRNFDSDFKTVTALNPDMRAEVDQAIETWSSRKLIQLFEPADGDKFARQESAKAFQRTYGVKEGMVKDSRKIRDLQNRSEKERVTALISAALTHLYATQLVLEATREVIHSVVQHTGLSDDVVRSSLETLLGSPAAGESRFLDRYEAMAFSGNDEAINFEKATQEVFQRFFGLKARHIGQGGTVPDVEVSATTWSAIVDTKAYAAYDLPQDHQLRMITNYVPRYRGRIDELPLACFLYISGGFARSFNAKLSTVIDRAECPGAGIAIRQWRKLISEFSASPRTGDELNQLFTLGREVTSTDVEEFLAARA